MRIKRSTESIVKGSLFKTAFQKKQASNGDEEIEKKNAEIEQTRKHLLLVSLFPLFLLAVVIYLIVLHLCPPSTNEIKLSENEKLLIIPAENALLETIEAGDIVQFYSADGSIGSIRHVLVYSVGTDGFGVAMTDQQLQDYLNAIENGTVTVIPIVMDDKEAAEAALAQQCRWNSPQITLAFSPSQYVIEAGQSTQLEVGVAASPEGATLPNISWHSSDDAIASVDANGMVSALSPGKVLITAVCGEQSASCTLSVMIYTTELHFDAEAYDMQIGEELQLALQAQPENTNEALTWVSSNEEILTVSAKGVVTAHAGGEATITAKGQNTEASVTVRIKVPASSVVLNSTELQLAVGGVGQLAAVVMPENASDKTVAWASSDAAIATVSADGTVQALAAGTVTVTATCGDVTASCTVTVSPAVQP